MSEVITDKFFDRITDAVFQDTEHGDLSYNYYIAPYDPTQEYEFREKIKWYCNTLSRPTHYQNILHINIFEEFCKFLDTKPFGKNPSYLKYLIEKECKDEYASDGVTRSLTEVAQSDDFIQHLNNLIRKHKEEEKILKTAFVFLSGIGDIYPYLRVSTLLNKYEVYNQTQEYKLIVFYPGKPVENSFLLFDKFNDQHVYRAALILDFRETQAQ